MPRFSTWQAQPSRLTSQGALTQGSREQAPTKSLCSERTQDWKRKFEQGLGWTVQELTGDSDLGTSGWRDVAHARIIVTTPEKWDSMTRKWHDHGATLSQLRLLWYVSIQRRARRSAETRLRT